MLGAIAGDVIGSAWEHRSLKVTDFELFSPRCQFTDDTVLTVATAHALLRGLPFADAYHEFGNRYPDAGYGGTFIRWLQEDARAPYGSWGNGSAMRVSPVGFVATSAGEAIELAKSTAIVTHDHEEGVRGAQAVALAVFLARGGHPKEEIRQRLVLHTGYDLSRSVDEIRPFYRFDVSCQGSVPEAILCFLEADDFEHAVRLAVSLGGDSDTQAAIAGGIAEAFWGEVPKPIADETLRRLPKGLRAVVEEFTARYPVR